MNKSRNRTFVGFGFGAIQGGLFLYEAYRTGRFGRLVVAEIMPDMVRALRDARGTYTVNVSTPDVIERHEVRGVEICCPSDPADRRKLVAALAEADEIATALPSVSFFDRGEHAPARWGAPVVVLKLGDQGLFCRWEERELRAPCFEVDVVGTTGSGDCTIAGFLAALLHGLPPEKVMTMAVAVGACCCEAVDATTGVRTWDETRQRIAGGWKKRPASGSDS